MKKDRIEALREQKEQIEKRLAALEAKKKAQERKDETRLKIVIGAGVMADAKKHPEVMELVQEILTRATTAKRDRDFLEANGWISAAHSRPTQTEKRDGREEGAV